MVNRLVEDRHGKVWRVEGVIDHWNTGERFAVITEYLTIEQILDKGCSYAASYMWAVPASEFREKFRWHNESAD